MGLSIEREGLFARVFGYTLPIRWYGLCYVVSYLYVQRQLQRHARIYSIPLSSGYISSLCECVLFGGIAGGRLWYLILRWIDEGTPISYHALHIWEGGMGIQGGFVMAIGFGISYLHLTRQLQQLPFVMDVILVHMTVAMGIGRIGNYLNQEFMNLVPVINIPSCIFAAMTEGALSFVLLRPLLAKQRYRPYTPSLRFGMTYSVVRFVNDIFREEPIYELLGLQWNLSQYLCVILFVSCLVITRTRRPRSLR